ncbi:unnamed protein product, partial [Ascophyllum nodosum]
GGPLFLFFAQIAAVCSRQSGRNGGTCQRGYNSPRDDTVAGMRVCIEVGQSQCPEPVCVV